MAEGRDSYRLRNRDGRVVSKAAAIQLKGRAPSWYGHFGRRTENQPTRLLKSSKLKAAKEVEERLQERSRRSDRHGRRDP